MLNIHRPTLISTIQKMPDAVNFPSYGSSMHMQILFFSLDVTVNES